MIGMSVDWPAGDDQIPNRKEDCDWYEFMKAAIEEVWK